MSEEVLYKNSNGNIVVTTSRFIVNNKTYALSGITSVSIWKQSPSYTGAALATIFGFFIAFIGFAANSTITLLIGAGLLLYGIYLFSALKTKYTVRIHTAGGEIDAVWSYDRELIEQIVDALNEAIIRRDEMFAKTQSMQNNP